MTTPLFTQKYREEDQPTHCVCCARHCPLTAPSCGRGRRFAEEVAAARNQHVVYEPTAPRIFDTLEEAEAARRDGRI
jgi:hypothetical protein